MKIKHLENVPLIFILILYPVLYQTDIFLTGITSEFINLILILVCGNILWLRKNKLCLNTLDILFLIFVAWYAGVKILMGPTLHYRPIIQLISYITLYFYFRNIPLKNRFFLILFCAGIIQSLWSILQTWGILPSYHYLLKNTGSFFNPAILGIFLVLATLAGISLFDRKLKSYIKILWFIGLTLLLLSIITSNSRASWVALAIGCFWLFLSGNHNIQDIGLKVLCLKKRFIKYIPVFILCTIILCTALYGLYSIRTDSVHGRLLIWQVIGSKIPETLWFGHGPLEALYMPAQADWFRANPDSTLTQVAGNNIYAFNECLRILFETGITGLLLAVLLLITGWKYALKGNKYSRYGGALLLAVLIFGQFSYPFSIGLITMVSIITLAIVSQNATVKHQYIVSNSLYIKWGITFLNCSIIILAIHEYSLQKKADLLLLESGQNSSLAVNDTLQHYYNHLQDDPDFTLCYGKTLFNHQLYEKALPVLQQAYRLRPSSHLVCDLGKCYQHMQRYREAEKAYLQASFMTPAYILPQYHLFCLYQDTGEMQKATEKAKYLLSMQVKIVNTTVLRSRTQARNYLKKQVEKSFIP